MRHALPLLLALLIWENALKAQVLFSENFQQGIPNTFTLINSDAKTPAAQVAYVTNAWVAAESNALTSDTSAVSTSWYTPAATADDWMITPAINLTGNAVLSWEAYAFDSDFRDGYEVRISTTSNSIANFTTILFSTGAEQTSPITHTVDLTPYNGNTVYLAFRNNSFNKNLLIVDDIKVELKPPYDLALQQATRPTEYSIIPRSQQKTFTPSVIVKNEGANALTNAKVFSILTKNGTIVRADSSAPFNLGIGLISSYNFQSYTPNDTGIYNLLYFTRIAQTDGNTTNDTARYSFLVTDSLYARDNGLITGSVSIGASDGEYGHLFELVHSVKIRSATAYLTNPNVGSITKFRLYNFTNNAPGNLVDSTISYVTTNSDSVNGKVLTLAFLGGTKLPIGKYLLVAVEQGGKRLNIGTTEKEQTNKANWYRYFGNPFFRWASGEEYDSLSASQVYTKVFAMRLNLEDACKLTPSFGFVTKPTCTNTGSVTVNYTSDNLPPYTYKWAGNQTSAVINSLIPGVYSVTVTDGFGCKFTGKDTVENIPITLTVQVQDVSCKGGSNGVATANPIGGNGSYTYVWNSVPQQSSKTATGLKKGVYTVTVTDGSCVSTAIAPILEPSIALTASVTQKSNPTSPNSNDGSITVAASGGQNPYQYIWSDSAVQQTLNNLPAGKYCVTVVDSRSCEIELCDTLGFGVSITETMLTGINLFPTPATDILYITSSYSQFDVTILNTTGAVVYQIPTVSGNTTIDVANIPAGIYIVELKSGNAILYKKIIISR